MIEKSREFREGRSSASSESRAANLLAANIIAMAVMVLMFDDEESDSRQEETGPAGS